jgi:hypothetical protein
MHSKIAKSANMIEKVSQQNQKTQHFMNTDSKFDTMGPQKRFRKKVVRIWNLHFSPMFLLITFSEHFLNPFQKIWNQHNLTQFLIPYNEISRFFCHISTCIKFIMYMPKGKFCKKVKNFIFCKYLSISVKSH